MTDLVNVVLLRAAAGKRALLGAALVEMVKLTSQEPGCAVIELNQSRDDADTWMVYERWRGPTAFDHHMKQPYVAGFLARMSDLVDGAADVRPFDYHG